MRGSKKIKYIFEKLRVSIFSKQNSIHYSLSITRSQHYPLLYQDVTCRCYKMLHVRTLSTVTFYQYSTH
jgi:hypothetical protein